MRLAGLRFLALLLMVPGANAAAVSYEGFLRLHPGAIRTVLSCGTWSTSDGRGIYRVIEGYIYGSSFLFVQWMIKDEDTGESLVKRTIDIPPFNDDHTDAKIEDLSCKSARDGVLITGNFTSAHFDDGIVRHLAVHLFADGSTPKIRVQWP